MSTATTPTPTLRARVRGLTRFYLTVPLLILTVLLIANGIFGRGLTLLDSTHIAGTLAASAPYVLSGMACVMPVLGGGGGLDMAIGPVLGFTTVLIAAVLVPGGIESPFLLVPLVLGFGLASGALSGWLGNYVRIPPVIATLGLYMAFAGLAPFVMPIPGGLVPDWLVGLTGMVGPVPGILFVYVAIGVMWWVLRRIGYVRNLLNVGGDERAAYTSGVEVQAVRMFAYMLGGMFCAIGGMLLAGTIHSGDATVGPIFTVVGLAGMALGGASLAGGRGGILGAGIGGFSYFLLQNLLTIAHVSVFHVQAAGGVILILALALNGGIEVLRKRTSQPAFGTSSAGVVPAQPEAGHAR